MEKYKEFLSPQAGGMLRFDQVDPISNDGTPVVKIPLYAVDDPDFDISGILQYSSGGFKPGDNDNFVGRDWTLTGGGVIYREVKGMPDDLGKVWGFYAYDGFLKNVTNPLFNDAEIRHLLQSDPKANVKHGVIAGNTIMNDLTYGLQNAKASDREVNSDVYNFRFGPHAGKFMINFDGTVNVVSYTGHKYVVDLTYYKNIEENRNSHFNSSITIRTDDGYTYKFGGNLGALEYTAYSWNKQFEYGSIDAGNIESEIVISAMHLTEIKSANERTLKYNYMNNVDDFYAVQRWKMVLNFDYNKLKASKAHLNCILNVRAYHNPQSPYTPVIMVNSDNEILFARDYDVRGTMPDHIVKSFSLNKLALIESIESDNSRIEFNYEEREVPYIDKSKVLGTSPLPVESGAVLRSVEVFDKEDSQWRSSKTHRLDYKYDGCRMFLKKLSHADDGTYVFDYRYRQVDPYTPRLDHWGFFNNANSLGEPLVLVPAIMQYPDNQDQILYSTIREPNLDCCSYNMLTNVYFPTGGYKTFEYEPHDYSSSITQVRGNSFRKTLTADDGGENKYAGGARVRKITYYGSDHKKIREVAYRYTNGIDSARSSGILMYMPRYVHHEKVSCYVLNDLIYPEPQPMVYENGDGINTPPAGNHVQYSRIIEIFQEETPLKKSVYKETVYSDYATNPDGLGTDQFYYAYSYSVGTLPEMIDMPRDYDYFCWMRAEMEDMSHERGKILRESYYAGADTIEKQVEYEYERRGGDKYNVLISSPAMYNTSFQLLFRSVRVPMCSYHQVGKVVTEYRDGVAKASSVIYEVDDDGYVKSETGTTSKGDRHKTKYKYVKDLFPMDKWCGLLTEKSDWLISSAGEKMLGRQTYGYSNFGRVASVNTYSAGNVLVENIRYIYTDGYGNPVLISRNGQEQEIIIWAYNGSRPVAVIRNVNYDEVKRRLGHNRILNNPANFYPKIAPEEIDALRGQLPGAHITTIEYNGKGQPISVTDPAGIKTCYQYLGDRLKIVYRMDGRRETVLEYYRYNYDVNRK